MKYAMLLLVVFAAFGCKKEQRNIIPTTDTTIIIKDTTIIYIDTCDKDTTIPLPYSHLNGTYVMDEDIRLGVTLKILDSAACSATFNFTIDAPKSDSITLKYTISELDKSLMLSGENIYPPVVFDIINGIYYPYIIEWRDGPEMGMKKKLTKIY